MKPRSAWTVIWIAGCLLSSCKLLDDHPTQSDPLRQAGPETSKAPSPTTTPVVAAPAANVPVATGPATPVPTVPPPKPSSLISPSTAALTSGLKSSDPANRLSIDTPPKTQSNTSPGGTSSLPTANVRQMRWKGDALTWEQARDQLKARGVTQLHLDYRDGSWRLQCTVPNPQDPQKVRFYDATGNDEIEAVRAVLGEMDGVVK